MHTLFFRAASGGPTRDPAGAVTGCAAREPPPPFQLA